MTAKDIYHDTTLENMNKFKHRLLIFAVISLVLFAVSCTQQAPQNSAAGNAVQNKTGKVRIGFLMDALQQERWQKDRDIFIKRAEELGAEVLLQTADGKDEVQLKQAESVLTQGVDVIVLVPHNAEVA
ncbi:MAG: hypothetical protein ABIP06_11090, partial [Pyrinomonadaceae bacterium]